MLCGPAPEVTRAHCPIYQDVLGSESSGVIGRTTHAGNRVTETKSLAEFLTSKSAAEKSRIEEDSLYCSVGRISMPDMSSAYGIMNRILGCTTNAWFAQECLYFSCVSFYDTRKSSHSVDRGQGICFGIGTSFLLAFWMFGHIFLGRVSVLTGRVKISAFSLPILNFCIQMAR